jgi:hypothetical protein
MSDEGEEWYDDEAGPVVRLYALTRGRTRSARYDLDLITLVTAGSRTDTDRLAPEYQRVLSVCTSPQSVAEVSAKVDLPLGVVQVLLGDLIEQNYLVTQSNWTPTDIPSLDMLQKVLNGIYKL